MNSNNHKSNTFCQNPLGGWFQKPNKNEHVG